MGTEFHGFGRRVLLCTVFTGLSAVLEVIIAFLIAGLGTAVIKGTHTFDLKLGVHLTTREAALGAMGAVIVRSGIDLVATQYRFRYIERYEFEARRDLLSDFLDAEWDVQSLDDSGNVQAVTIAYLNLARQSLGQIQDTSTAMVAFSLFLVGSIVAGGPWLLAILAGTGLLALALRPLVDYAHRAGKAMRDSQREFTRTVIEVFAMAREIRLFKATDHVKQQISSSAEAVADANRRSGISAAVLASLQASAVYLVGSIGLVTIVLANVRDPEPYVVVVLLIYRGLGNGRVFQSSYQSLVSSAPSIIDMQEHRDRYRAAALPSTGVEFVAPLTAVEFEGVSFAYPGGQVALTDATFSIERGAALGLVGPSGSGKSTIVQLLLRLRLPTAGTIRINGTDITDLRPASWFGHAVLVPQEAQLFSATVLDNVTSFRDSITREQAIEALRRAHVLDEILALPNGIDTDLGEGGRALSGGQRQRVCIARALAATPDVLILDEPTSALDLISEEGIRATLEGLRGQMTIVIIAHRLSTLRVCDTVMVLNGGRIEAVGDRADLEANGGFYAEAVKLAKLV